MESGGSRSRHIKSSRSDSCTMLNIYTYVYICIVYRRKTQPSNPSPSNAMYHQTFDEHYIFDVLKIAGSSLVFFG